MIDTARRGSSDRSEQANLPLDYFFSYQQIIKGGHTRKKELAELGDVCIRLDSFEGVSKMNQRKDFRSRAAKTTTGIRYLAFARIW